MTTSNLPDKTFGKHAIVIGSSIAGLVAGRILADHFEEVTIVERDQLNEVVDFRKGVPQGRHAHALLKRGEQIFEELFPGLGEQLKAQGALQFNMGSEFAWFLYGGWRPRYESTINNLACSRPLLETSIRRRLSGFSNVTFKANWEITGLQTDLARSKATGVKLRSRDNMQTEQLMQADLVVDTTGRSSRAPEWLSALGYVPPSETVIDAFLGYATAIYNRPADFQAYWKLLYIQPTPPNGTRGGIIIPIEGNRWYVTLIGMNQDYPPTNEVDYLEFARSLPVPDLYEAIRVAEPATDIVGFRSGSNRLRHYEQLPKFLENFVVLGDSVFAFNPTYGQGMSVAALSAYELSNCLRERQDTKAGLTGLAEQFQKRLPVATEIPWQIATMEDLRWPGTVGAEITTDPTVELMQNYLKQVMVASTKNPAITEAFYRVMNLLDSPGLFFQPDLVLQVAAEMSVNSAH